MVKSCMYCNLPSFEDGVPITSNFDDTKRFVQKLYRWIWAFCSNIDLCRGHLYFIRGMNMEVSAISMRMHVNAF